MERGTKLHAKCEEYLQDKDCEVPMELSAISDAMMRLRARKAVPERAFRLDAEWKPVAHGGRVIGIMDAHFFTENALNIYDFKSGRAYPTHKKQLELYALIGLQTYPDVDRVECGAIYIDSGKIGYKRTVERSEAEPMRIDWHARAETMFADDDMKASPGRGCYWCDFKDVAGGPCSEWRKA